MSYCREEGMLKTFLHIYSLLVVVMRLAYSAGKDKLIFVTEVDHAEPSTVVLPEDEDEEMEGLIKPSGEINWDCPCLQGMAYGPCGEQFKSAFSCFHYSESDPKGSDCIPAFREMQECFMKYPDLYGRDEDELKDGTFDDVENELESENIAGKENNKRDNNTESAGETANTSLISGTDKGSKPEQLEESKTNS